MTGFRQVGRSAALAVVLGAATWGAGAQAQTNAPPGVGQAAIERSVEQSERMKWREVVESGGFLMYVLAGVSVLTLALTIYFAAVLRAGLAVPRPLYRELVEKIRAGALDDARRACEYKPCALSSITLVALDHMRNLPHLAPTLLKDIVEGEGSRQAERIQGQTQVLLDIAVIAPMIGLLGTVFGMLQAFSAVALDIAQAKPIVLAAGVSKALITTAFGLIVGIPAMVFYAFFRRRAAAVVIHLESAAAEVVTVLLSRSGE